MSRKQNHSQEAAIQSLPIGDVEAIIRLLGQVAGMEAPIPNRRRALIEGLCDMVKADIWIWIHGRVDPGTNFPSAFKVMDGGWKSDSERAAFLTALHDPAVNAIIVSKMIVMQHCTILRQDVFSDGNPNEMAVLDHWTSLCGMREAITTTYMLDPHTFSGLGLHCRAGKPPFTSKERCIVHLITSQIDWLHRAETQVPANTDKLLDLSPREREVLVHLMGGDSTKQIAYKLKLSKHTIADHMKVIYRNFNINSRAELLGLFMTGLSR